MATVDSDNLSDTNSNSSSYKYWQHEYPILIVSQMHVQILVVFKNAKGKYITVIMINTD